MYINIYNELVSERGFGSHEDFIDYVTWVFNSKPPSQKPLVVKPRYSYKDMFLVYLKDSNRVEVFEKGFLTSDVLTQVTTVSLGSLVFNTLADQVQTREHYEEIDYLYPEEIDDMFTGIYVQMVIEKLKQKAIRKSEFRPRG